MIDAIVRSGNIIPLGPLPPEWRDGTPVQVQSAEDTISDLDAWAAEMNHLCLKSTDEDDAIMFKAIAEHRQLAKAQMRWQMDLPE